MVVFRLTLLESLEFRMGRIDCFTDTQLERRKIREIPHTPAVSWIFDGNVGISSANQFQNPSRDQLDL